MFAYNPLSSGCLSPEQQRARHFSYREWRSLDWTRNSTMIVLFAVFLGGCAKLLTLPPAAVGLTLMVAIGFLEDRPCIDTPFWMGRAALASIAAFYSVLGFGMGAYALLAVGLLMAIHRQIFD